MIETDRIRYERGVRELHAANQLSRIRKFGYEAISRIGLGPYDYQQKQELDIYNGPLSGRVSYDVAIALHALAIAPKPDPQNELLVGQVRERISKSDRMRTINRSMWPSLVFMTESLNLPIPGEDLVGDIHTLFDLTGHPADDGVIKGYGFFGWPVSKLGNYMVSEKIRKMPNIGVYTTNEQKHVIGATIATAVEIDSLPPTVGEAFEILSENAFLVNPHWSYLRVRDLRWRQENSDPTMIRPVEYRQSI